MMKAETLVAVSLAKAGKHAATGGGVSLMPGNDALIADDDEFFGCALRAILMDKFGFSEAIETAALDEAIEQLSKRAKSGERGFIFSGDVEFLELYQRVGLT